jgi:hypothetical protein
MEGKNACGIMVGKLERQLFQRLISQKEMGLRKSGCKQVFWTEKAEYRVCMLTVLAARHCPIPYFYFGAALFKCTKRER